MLPKILIIYEFFDPAYKAGGIIQSLRNMINLLQNDYEFHVITGAYDLNELQPLKGIQVNEWNKMKIADNTTVNIWYDDKKSLGIIKMKRLINYVTPDIIYINGFMHISFLINPLMVIKYSALRNSKTIVAPRGMLQVGAVATKSFKKKYYLKLIQLLGLTNNIYWHITAMNELNGIRYYFPKSSVRNTLAGNIPQKPVEQIVTSNKQAGTLSLLYASIITEKKNLYYLLESLQLAQSSILLSIYGVIKEPVYWDKCKILIQQLPQNIQIEYKGDYQPQQIQSIISKHDAIVLLSKGENFSHAIFESLGVGRPVISSHFTSWNNLTTEHAGWNFTIDNQSETAKSIDQLATMNNEEWMPYCSGAHLLAKQYLAKQDFKNDYKQLFG